MEAGAPPPLPRACACQCHNTGVHEVGVQPEIESVPGRLEAENHSEIHDLVEKAVHHIARIARTAYGVRLRAAP